jgi:protein SCO1/2
LTAERVAVGGDFRLIDHDGIPVSLSTYAGQYLLVFFGFTHCRRVCPETLSLISRSLDTLGPQASCFQPLYISVDPERDSPEVMKTFLAERYPRFTGLTGDRKEIDETKTRIKVFAHRTPDEDDPDGYAIPHSALIYLMDRRGAYLRHFSDGVTEGDLATGLRNLFDEEGRTRSTV